jgi:hypothetical protein
MNAIPLINNAPRPNINVGSIGSPAFNPVAAGAKLGGSIGGNVMRQNPASMPVNNETQLRQEVNTSIVALKREAFSLENLIAQAAQTLQNINKRLSELEGKQGDYVKKADATVASVGGDGKYISAISETDGKINATATDLGNMVPVNSVTSGNMHSVTSNAVYGYFKKKIVKKSVTVNAQDSFGGSVSVIDDGYEAVMAVITNTGDNKLYAYRQNFTSQGLFYYSLQNWNTIAITVNIEITVLERKI